MKRVVIIGAESTGKTTLATALAEHYRTAWVPEFGRLYTEARRYRGELWRSDEFTYIAAEQARMEDALARIADRVLICDTDPFATTIWHIRDGESIRQWMHDRFLDELSRMVTPSLLVSGPHERRLAEAVKRIDQLL